MILIISLHVGSIIKYVSLYTFLGTMHHISTVQTEIIFNAEPSTTQGSEIRL